MKKKVASGRAGRDDPAVYAFNAIDSLPAGTLLLPIFSGPAHHYSGTRFRKTKKWVVDLRPSTMDLA